MPPAPVCFAVGVLSGFPQAAVVLLVSLKMVAKRVCIPSPNISETATWLCWCSFRCSFFRPSMCMCLFELAFSFSLWWVSKGRQEGALKPFGEVPSKQAPPPNKPKTIKPTNFYQENQEIPDEKRHTRRISPLPPDFPGAFGGLPRRPGGRVPTPSLSDGYESVKTWDVAQKAKRQGKPQV